MTFSEIKDKIVDYYNSNKKQALVLAGAVLVIIIAVILIIVICVNSGKKKKNDKRDVVFTEQVLIPDGPEIQKDYNISRQTKEAWSEEEADEWFTIPSQKEIDNLEKANDGLINDLTGAAP